MNEAEALDFVMTAAETSKRWGKPDRPVAWTFVTKNDRCVWRKISW